MKEKLLISSCLCGNCCKYNGGHNLLPQLDELKEKYHLICVCPEVLGKLSTPRPPSEIIKDNIVYNNIGQDVTKNFNLGARLALVVANKNSVIKALLKEGSPSCGVYKIYDGTFSGTKIEGNGITTRLLKENNIEVYSSDEVNILLGRDK